jgi:glycosyltransferase involved in cell wall biosynthesis
MALDRPTVSVVLPTYNRAPLLSRAVTSVLDQTYRDFELIIVDDASTDGTAKVVEGFLDTRIRYIRNKQQEGAAASRNIGIKATKGSLIGFQDSDDEWLPEKLEKQVAAFSNASPGVGVVFTGFVTVGPSGRSYRPAPWVRTTDGDIHLELLKGNFVGTPAALVKRECLEKVGGFNEMLASLEDWELWLRISKYYRFMFLKEPLFIAHHSAGSVNSHSGLSYSTTLKTILKQHGESFMQAHKCRASMEFKIGHLECKSGTFEEGKQYLERASTANPLNLKYFAARLLSTFGRDAYRASVELKQSVSLLLKVAINHLRKFRLWH